MKKFLFNVAFVVMTLTGMTMLQACSSDDEPKAASREGEKWDYRGYYEQLLNSDEWRQFASTAERRQACQIPEEELPRYTTDELIDICMVFPFRCDFAAYNDMMMGFSHTFHTFNAYNELLGREDAADAILRFYDQAELSLDSERPYSAVYPTKLGILDALVVEAMMLSGDFPKMYEPELLPLLDKVTREKLEYKHAHPDIYSSFSCGFLHDIRARIEAID